MIKRLPLLVVAFSLTASIPCQAKDFAASIDHDGRMIVLTDQNCRYDKYLPEAYYVAGNGDRTYLCYWFGVKHVHLESPTHRVDPVPKKTFNLVKNII